MGFFYDEVIMKYITIFAISLSSMIVHAQDRILKCNALDNLGNEYSFEMNLSTGDIKKTTAEGSLKTLYSDEKRCGLNVGKAVCSQVLNHNLDKPDQPYYAVTFNIRCKSKGGTILQEFNGSAEINRSGDGYGSFMCGSLPSNELQLSNCSFY